MIYLCAPTVVHINYPNYHLCFEVIRAPSTFGWLSNMDLCRFIWVSMFVYCVDWWSLTETEKKNTAIVYVRHSKTFTSGLASCSLGARWQVPNNVVRNRSLHFWNCSALVTAVPMPSSNIIGDTHLENHAIRNMRGGFLVLFWINNT